MCGFQVRQLLNDEPPNSEYVDMERELCEVCLVSLFLYFLLPVKLASLSYSSPGMFMCPTCSTLIHLKYPPSVIFFISQKKILN